MKRILFVLFTVSVLTLQSPGNNKDKHLVTDDKKRLLKEWKLESSTQVSEKESVISSSGFNDDISMLPDEVKPVTAQFAKKDLESKETLLVQDKDR